MYAMYSLFYLRKLIEKNIEENIKSFIVAIDFEKTYQQVVDKTIVEVSEGNQDYNGKYEQSITDGGKFRGNRMVHGESIQ